MTKLKVEIFSPAGECDCSYSTWTNKVWDILNEHLEEIEIVNLTSATPRAKELGVGGRSVVVDGEKIAVFNLKQVLGRLLEK